jgi:hypothetical protein
MPAMITAPPATTQLRQLSPGSAGRVSWSLVSFSGLDFVFEFRHAVR